MYRRRSRSRDGAEQVGHASIASLLRLLHGLRRCFWNTYALFRSQQRDQNVAFHARHRLDLSEIPDFAQQASHFRAADFLVRHFTAAMKNHGAYFVAFPEKLDDLVFANLIIVLGGGRPELYLFELRAAAAFALLMRLFILLVKIFSIIGNLANWRVRRWRDFDQVESAFASHANGLIGLHDSKLGSVFINHPDFAGPNPFIDAGTVALPEIPISDKFPLVVKGAEDGPQICPA